VVVGRATVRRSKDKIVEVPRGKASQIFSSPKGLDTTELYVERDFRPPSPVRRDSSSFCAPYPARSVRG